MKRTWTIIGVANMPQSSKWYQSLLGLPEAAPAHDYFGQIVDSDGTVLLCLHEWGAHEHPSLTSPHYAKPGNGLLLFFRVDNFDVALPRARALVSRLEEEPHVNPTLELRSFRSEILTDTTSPSARSIPPNPSIEPTGSGRLCRWETAVPACLLWVQLASRASRRRLPLPRKPTFNLGNGISEGCQTQTLFTVREPLSSHPTQPP